MFGLYGTLWRMTRGEQIRAARRMRRPRMSQLDLANATGVGMRTIGRIEAGEAENSPSLDALEAYLGLDDQTHPDAASHDADGPRLKEATLMQLCLELTSRVADLEARLARAGL
jgi:transcriptional regulator with XRE-family HTH domain